MSNLIREPQAANPGVDSPCVDHPCSAIELIITPRSKDLDGFSVRRVLPYHKRRMVGPWVFFDHIGPVTFAAGSGIDVRPHPHINLATATYLFEGEILHRDSLGFAVAIQPGDINLMVAGRGITHSERETAAVRAREHRLHALQLWLALPEADEEVAPAFHHYAEAEIPTSVVDGVALRVMMGSAYGLTSPVRTFATTLYVEARLGPGQRLPQPLAEELAVYVASGAVRIDGTRVEQHQMAVLAPGATHPIEADGDCRIAIIGGARMPARHMFWNFVSSSPARIEQAKADWKAGRFPTVVGDEHAFIPLPE